MVSACAARLDGHIYDATLEHERSRDIFHVHGSDGLRGGKFRIEEVDQGRKTCTYVCSHDVTLKVRDQG